MNVPIINRSILRMHVAALEAKHPIKIVGLLPRGSAGHVVQDDAFQLKYKPWPQRFRGLRSEICEITSSTAIGRSILAL
jgi:hypothetical protein